MTETTVISSTYRFIGPPEYGTGIRDVHIVLLKSTDFGFPRFSTLVGTTWCHNLTGFGLSFGTPRLRYVTQVTLCKAHRTQPTLVHPANEAGLPGRHLQEVGEAAGLAWEGAGAAPWGSWGYLKAEGCAFPSACLHSVRECFLTTLCAAALCSTFRPAIARVFARRNDRSTRSPAGSHLRDVAARLALR